MQSSQRSDWMASVNFAFVLILAWQGMGTGTAMATPMFPDINFQRQPDRIDGDSADVQQSARTLARPCSSHTAVAWNSAKPMDDLRTLSEDLMHKLPAFTGLNEMRIAASQAADSTQRLYIGKSDKFFFTFLWRAGQDEVSLQICSDQPLKAKDRFTFCVGSAPGVTYPLGVCPRSHDK